jgi:NADH-quinone oxidoreductase subunit N
MIAPQGTPTVAELPGLLLPELCVAAGMLLCMLSTLVPAWRSSRLSLWIAVTAALAAFVSALAPSRAAIEPMLALDPIAGAARVVIAGALVLLLLAGAGERRRATDHDAWSTCVLGTGLGAMLVSAASNVLPLWLGLELISLGSYALAAWRAGDRRAAEAGMKYVLFGSTASGLMLFGMSHLYGLTGHLDFLGIGQQLAREMPVGVVAALVLAGVGIAYKLTLVPFHFYAPDVYEGAPALSVGVVATLPKIAATAVLVRALGLALPASLAAPTQVGAVLAGVAIASLGVAAFTALAQRDARRIVAFSGIGHGGTIVLGAAALPGPDATAAVLLYVTAYAAATLGALVCLSVLEREQGSSALKALPGAMQRKPWVTAALCLFLASLVGIPPLAGFLGKWSVLQLALHGGPMLVAGALVLLATTAILAWAYLLIVRAAVLAPAPQPVAAPMRVPVSSAIVLAVCAAATVGLGLWLDALPALVRLVQP